MLKKKIKKVLLFSLILSSVLVIGQANNASAASSKKLNLRQIGVVEDGAIIKWDKIDGASYYELTGMKGKKSKVYGTSVQFYLPDGNTQKIAICPMNKNNKKVKGTSKGKLEVYTRPQIPYAVDNDGNKLGITKNYNNSATVVWKKASKKYVVHIKLITFNFSNGNPEKTQHFYTKGNKGKYVFKGLSSDKGYMVYVDVYMAKKKTVHNENYGYFTVGQKTSKYTKVVSGKNYNKKFECPGITGIGKYNVLASNANVYKPFKGNTASFGKKTSYVIVCPVMPDNILRTKGYKPVRYCYVKGGKIKKYTMLVK